MEFENVILSDKTREVAAHISGYIGKKLVIKFGHFSKNYCIKSQKKHQQLKYIFIFCREVDLFYPQNAL